MKAILQKEDYKTLCIVDVEKARQNPEEVKRLYSEYEMVYPYYVDLSYEGVFNKAEVWEDIKNAKKLLWGFVFDVDYIPELKKKFKENLHELQDHLTHFKVLRAKEILKELQKHDIAPERIIFTNGKTSFHIIIKPLKPLPLNAYTKSIVDYEYKQLFNLVANILAKYPYYTLDVWGENKATHLDILNLEYPIDHDLIGYLFYNYIDVENSEKEKDVSKLERIIPQMVEVFKNGDHEGVGIFGGQHHSFIVLLAGELAISGFTLEEALDIYDRYFAPHDNPRDYKERIAVIRHTYKRKENGEPVASWRMYKPEWKLSRPKNNTPRVKLSPDDFLRRGVKSYVYPDKGKMWEQRLDVKGNNPKTGKKHYRITTRELKFPYVVEPIAFTDDKIRFCLYNENEYYTIIAPYPSTQMNIKDFENAISHLPLTKRQVRTLKMIIESFVAFKDVWQAKIEVKNIYNEKEGLRELNTGLCDVADLWKTNKLYRLTLTLSIAKFQNPDLPNAVVWVWGETGAGKTRTLTQIAHAFGEDVLLNATYNALETYASTIQHKPVVIEDLAVYRERLRDVFNLIFTAYSGVGKARRTNVAGSTRIYTNRISASFFLASEINPTVYLTLNSAEVGILRRVFILHLPQKLQFPSLTDGKGWATMLAKIQPTPEDYAVLDNYHIHEWHARTYLPYVVAVYRVFNEMFNTDFDPLSEYAEMTMHLEDVLEKTVKKSLVQWVKQQLFGNPKQKYVITNPFDGSIVIPDMLLDIISPLFNVDENKMRFYFQKWGLPTKSVEIPTAKGFFVEGWDVSSLLGSSGNKKEVDNEGEGMPF